MATSLFYLNLARLSVDIDLNYIGSIDREATLTERPQIVKAVEQIFAGVGYKLRNGVDDYALREWYLNFTNHAVRPDRIQVEINFLMRACALPHRVECFQLLAQAQVGTVWHDSGGVGTKLGNDLGNKFCRD